MSVVIILVFVAIVLAGGFLVAFIWSVKNGQFEDTYTPSVRILFDDPPIKEKKEEKENRNQENEESRSVNSQKADHSQPESHNP